MAIATPSQDEKIAQETMNDDPEDDFDSDQVAPASVTSFLSIGDGCTSQEE